MISAITSIGSNRPVDSGPGTAMAIKGTTRIPRPPTEVFEKPTRKAEIAIYNMETRVTDIGKQKYTYSTIIGAATAAICSRPKSISTSFRANAMAVPGPWLVTTVPSTSTSAPAADGSRRLLTWLG
jgi:hypothetical protein